MSFHLPQQHTTTTITHQTKLVWPACITAHLTRLQFHYTDKEELVRQLVMSEPIESFPWWRVGLPRNEALAALSGVKSGSFVLRDSSQPGACVSV